MTWSLQYVEHECLFLLVYDDVAFFVNIQYYLYVDYCVSDKDDFEGIVCQNGGKCIDGLSLFTCQCEPDFEGTLCELRMYSFCVSVLWLNVILLSLQIRLIFTKNNWNWLSLEIDEQM